jgi:hypothetical protein
MKNKTWFEPLTLPPKRGRPPSGKALTPRQRKKKWREKKNKSRKENIAILDMETDPFDNQSKARIYPFLAILYSDNFEPVIIWDEDHDAFVRRVVASIENLPDRYVIYAHNGGRFDFMFLVHKLRGEVSFKGRGIMSATIGRHELRDSFHIIPEKLAAYQKNAFDYTKLIKGKRGQHRDEIIRYCLNDCKFLLEIVKGFIDEFGLKLSIGQAAMYELKQHYEVKKLSLNWDEYLRTYFFGGRVECLVGRFKQKGDFKLYDVNSMYPYVMATCEHPIGDFFDYDLRPGEPNDKTVFIDLNCDNRGALIGKTDEGETTSSIKSGNFLTTIWEYKIALKYNLISNIRINFCIDCGERTNFAKFVSPLYEKRTITKNILADYKKMGDQSSEKFLTIKRDDTFLKLILNNAYGKFAQNPRRFKEYYLTDPDEIPPADWFRSLMPKIEKKDWPKVAKNFENYIKPENEIYLLPESENAGYWIWHKPAPGFRFNNVGTAASITGAARAVLLEALQLAIDPIYCDTDSIICRDLPGVDCHPERLGAWDLEDEFSEVIIDGKKLYSCRFKKPRMAPDGQITEYKIRSKGTSGLKWLDMVDLFDGKSVTIKNKGPTMTRDGKQYYLARKIQATAKTQRAI